MSRKKTLQNSPKDLQSQAMNRLSFLMILIISIVSLRSISRAESAPEANVLFQNALTAYKKKNLEEAKQLFSQILKTTPSSEVYYDLGLVEYESKNLGPAVANWRKALALDPNNQLADQSLLFIKKRIEHPELNRHTDNFEVLRERLLNHSQLEYLVLFSCFIFLGSSWLLLSYIGERRRSREQELTVPTLPWTMPIMALLLVISIGMSGAKIYDSSLVRATVLPSKIQVLSAPDAESTQLFELFEGLEVIVESSQGEYVQVSFPGGMTGWTLRKNLMLNDGQES